MSDALLRFRDVSFSYDPQRRVFEGLNLELGAGERVGLMGPNGSGKTTLLHLAVGLIHPAEGGIEAFGRRRVSEKDFFEVRMRAGLLFQDPEDQLFCATVAEDVAFGPFNLGKSRGDVAAIVADTLSAVGLHGYAERITHQLSGGEKRLVSLACVLAMQPDVLLLDEPTNGLDENACELVVDILSRLPQAMVIVSHDRAAVQRLATRTVLLGNGRLQPCDV